MTVASGALLEPMVWLPAQLFTGDFLYYGVVFSAPAIVAAVLGMRGIAGVTIAIARIFILVFLVLAIVSLIL